MDQEIESEKDSVKPCMVKIVLLWEGIGSCMRPWTHFKPDIISKAYGHGLGYTHINTQTHKMETICLSAHICLHSAQDFYFISLKVDVSPKTIK